MIIKATVKIERGSNLVFISDSGSPYIYQLQFRSPGVCKKIAEIINFDGLGMWSIPKALKERGGHE